MSGRPGWRPAHAKEEEAMRLGREVEANLWRVLSALLVVTASCSAVLRPKYLQRASYVSSAILVQLVWSLD